MDMGPRRLGLGAFITVLLLVAVALPAISQTWGSTQLSLSPQNVYSSSDWASWAATAWKYFQPGVGVSSTTGLHRAATSWHCFAEWDLGSYIYAVIYASKLSLIVDGTGSGDWQFKDRVNKIINFLKTRPLASGNTPYEYYEWNTLPYTYCSDIGPVPTNIPDSGRLLAALYALKTYSTTYASDVTTIFNRSKSAYDSFANSFVSQPATDYYSYAVAEGYAAFGYNMASLFNGVDNYAGGYIPVNGQNLPLFKTTAEPINHVILEADLAYHPPTSTFLKFADRVYLAQYGRYTATNYYTGWSEGGYPSTSYIYEWVLIYYGGSWKTWLLTDAAPTITYPSLTPAAFVKVAFSYLAIYGENTYTLAMVNKAKTLLSSCTSGQHLCTVTASAGFGEGVYQTNGASIFGTYFASDKTNEFILAAAYYAMNNSPYQPPNSNSNPLSNMGNVMTASAGTVWFVLPDYTGPYHAPASKCGGVVPAALSDYSAGGYLLGLLQNPQNQILDTSSSISQATASCGNPTGIPTGSSGTIVTFAGKAVNELVNYYENIAVVSPIYFLFNGAYNFVDRSNGQTYTVSVGPKLDYFLMEGFTDGSGRKVFIFYGLSWQGTLAAGVFFTANVYPQLAQFGNSWYIYKWQDASSGTSNNSFPDPGDVYTTMWSSGSFPSLTPQSNPPTGNTYSGFAGIENNVLEASQGSAYFVLPDYSAPFHTPLSKCGGVIPAALSDYSAGGYMLSVLFNSQNEVLDTSSLVSSGSSSCGQFTGPTSTSLVLTAGPAVNTAVVYYERVAQTSPVYVTASGGQFVFVVRDGTQGPFGGVPSSGDDRFLLESFLDGQRHVYIIYGFSWQGTLAGATFLSTRVRSNLSLFQNSWYIYHWTDASSGLRHNSIPDPYGAGSPSDTYTLVATG